MIHELPTDYELPDSAAVLVTVTAGQQVFTNDDSLAKYWYATKEDWFNSGDQAGIKRELRVAAQTYAAEISADPRQVTWTRTDWSWYV